ncbi:MAG: efflux RND transporter permease subunit, partial [Acidobacteria bacterium]
MTPAEFPVRRPVATAMIFAALVLLGAIAWRIIPVELFPDIEGDRLSVAFTRPGSEPEVVERELLRALEARVETLPGVAETWGTVTGDSGRLRIRFEPGTDLHVRDLDLRRIAADLERTQPRGTRIEVQSFDTEIVSRFVMVVQITGAGDRFALRDLAEEEIRPRLASVPGVSAAMLFGGAPRELRIAIDPQRIAALGIDAASVAERVTAALARPRFAGTAASGAGRAAVLVDGRPEGEVSLARLTLVPGRNVQLRHVADVALTAGEEEERARVDGRPAVTLVLFKQAEANLVRVGRALRERLHELEREFAASGLRFTIAFDGARTVEEQLRRLEKLAAGGFAIALAVLLLFLRQLRPVAVVAVSVPASLLIGVALLYLSGQSVNLITLFGLAVGIGMLVDNSIVVYEAVQRRLERGDGPDEAAVRGVGTTARAILAATATNAVVFVPLAFTVFESGLVRRLLEVLALAYLIPLAASLLVALGLVPLLARYLAAPAALARLAAERARRRAHGGLPVPSRAREVFSALLAVALRRPGAWLAATGLLVVASALVGAVWLGASAGGAEPARADEVRLQVDLPPGLSLDGATERVAVLEEAALAIGGVERVTSLVREEDASLTIRLEPEERRPPGTDAALVRERLQRAAREMTGVEIRSVGSGGGGGEEDEGLQELLGQAAPEVVISGPDADRLAELARQIEAALEELPEVASAWPRARPGREEVWVEPEQRALASLGLTAGEVLPVLALLRREGFELQVGYQERAGREIPVVFRRPGRVDREAVTRLPVVTPAGVRRLGTLARLRRAGSPTAIQHHNGRLEIAVRYRLSPQAPRTGPERAAL